MAGVAASEARSFEQWQATLDDRIAATVALGAKRFSEGLGWFAFQDHALEQDYLEYSFVTWTPRAKIIVRVSAVYYALLSLASMLDWSWYLNSTGHPTNAVDAIQTHVPTCILLVFNVVLHTPLWSPARFQATLSLFIVQPRRRGSSPSLRRRRRVTVSGQGKCDKPRDAKLSGNVSVQEASAGGKKSPFHLL